MKKAGQLLAVLTAASVLLSGCEKLKDVTTTSVYVSKNGVVTEAAGNRNGRSGALRFWYSRDQRKKHGGYGRRVDHKVHRECFCVIIRAD